MTGEREIFEVDFTGLQRAADDICAALDRARQQRDEARAEVERLQRELTRLTEEMKYART